MTTTFAQRWAPTSMLIAAAIALTMAPSGSLHADAVSKTATTHAERPVARACEEVTRRVRDDPAYRPVTFRDGVDTKRTVYPDGDVTSGTFTATPTGDVFYLDGGTDDAGGRTVAETFVKQ